MARINSLRKHCAKQCLDLVIHQALAQTEKIPDVHDALLRLLAKTMAEHFMQAPDHYTVEGALRWGQILDLGGDAALADALVATRLGQSFGHERYWEKILRFFVHNVGLLLPHVGAIVEYLDFHKFIFRLEPPLPEKRTTVLELLDRVADWQSPRLTDCQAPELKWHNAGIGNFECQEYLGRNYGVRIWTIRELLDTNALTAEGKIMRHCVGNYGSRCSKRVSSIWSMMCHSRLGQEHVLTIEIDPSTRTIVQAKGKRNSPPSPQTRRIMLKWAATQHLTVAESV